VQKSNPDPMVLQIYMNCAIFASSFLVLLPANTAFTPDYYALISSCMWVTSNILSIFAIKNIGIGAVQGISSGLTIFVAFLWGNLVFGESVDNTVVSVLGIVCLAAGIAGMTISGSDMLEKFFAEDMEPDRTEHSEAEKLLPTERKSTNLYTLTVSWSSEEQSGTKTLIGVMCACVLGLTNGTMLIPLMYSPHDVARNTDLGQLFLVSFGIGVFLLTPIFAGVYFFVLIRFFKKKSTVEC